MRKLFILICFMVASNFNYSQSSNDSIPSIVERYDNLVEESSSYKKYKVIEKDKVKAFRKEIVKSNDSLQSVISQQKKQQNELGSTIDNLKAELNETQIALDEIKQKTDSMAFVGLPMQKTTYRLVVWLIIVALIVLSIVLFVNYRKSNFVTQSTKESMKSLEKEYEEYRRNAIEKQQKQGRQILDLQKSVKKKTGSTNTGNYKNNT